MHATLGRSPPWLTVSIQGLLPHLPQHFPSHPIIIPSPPSTTYPVPHAPSTLPHPPTHLPPPPPHPLRPRPASQDGRRAGKVCELEDQVVRRPSTWGNASDPQKPPRLPSAPCPCKQQLARAPHGGGVGAGCPGFVATHPVSPRAHISHHRRSWNVPSQGCGDCSTRPRSCKSCCCCCWWWWWWEAASSSFCSNHHGRRV